jgi:hypothetical protein
MCLYICKYIHTHMYMYIYIYIYIYVYVQTGIPDTLATDDRVKDIWVTNKSDNIVPIIDNAMKNLDQKLGDIFINNEKELPPSELGSVPGLGGRVVGSVPLNDNTGYFIYKYVYRFTYSYLCGCIHTYIYVYVYIYSIIDSLFQRTLC